MLCNSEKSSTFAGCYRWEDGGFRFLGFKSIEDLARTDCRGG